MCISKRKLEPFSVGARVVSDFLDRRVSIFFNLKSKSLRQKSQKPFKIHKVMTCVPALLGSNELRFLSCKLVQGCFHLIKLLFAISFFWKVIFC